jgi:hypothetical protein
MTDQEQLDAERSIHALLCGRCDDAQRLALLKRLARDEHLRGLLAEMIRTQELARAAYGYPSGDQSLELVISKAMEGLSKGGQAAKAAKAAPPRRLGKSAWRRVFWPAAAAAVIAASLFLAIDIHRTNVLLREQLSAAGNRTEPIPAGQLQPAEMQRLRNIWAEIADAGEASRTWILMGGQSGEFGYVNGAKPAGANRPIVVRLILVSADGKVVEKTNLLLPRQSIGRLALVDAGRLLGIPFGLEVDSSESRTRVALTLGQGGGDSVGVSGKVRVGNGAEEIGWLRVAGKDLRVVIQALPLSVGVS